MEDNPEIFPFANLTYIMNKIKEGSVAFPSVNDYAVHLVKLMDWNGDGSVSIDEFKAFLEHNNVYLTDHELHSLAWNFDHDHNGKISIEEFFNALK